RSEGGPGPPREGRARRGRGAGRRRARGEWRVPACPGGRFSARTGRVLGPGVGSAGLASGRCVLLVECAVVLFLSLHRAHAGWFGRSGGQRSKTVGNESGGTAHDRCCRRESSRE